MENKYTILYAEDNDSIRENYVSFLKSYFGKVYEANNGTSALELYNKNRPDVLLLDINMPGINGLDLAKQIRQKDETVKIVMLTAYSDTEKLLQATELNLTKYLVKPIKTFELEEIVTSTIEKLNSQNTEESYLQINPEFKWDKINHKLYKNDEDISLTKKEMVLLNLFCTNVDSTFSNAQIMDHLWKDDFNLDPNTSKLRVLFSKLRSKIEYDLFITTYGIGYKLKLED